MSNYEPKTNRASSTGGPGKRVVDQAKWRKEVIESRIKFDDLAKGRFLELYARDGNFRSAAKACGVAYSTVKLHIDTDPDFAEAVFEAKEDYKDRVITHAQSLIFDGVKEPIFGGQFKDEHVGDKVTFPTNLLAMEMKRVEKGYHERSEVDVTVKGGVLLIPQGETVDTWADKFGKKTPSLPTDIEDAETSE